MKKKTILFLLLSLLPIAFVALATFFLTNGSLDKKESSPVTSSADDKSKFANEESLAKNTTPLETSDWKEYCNKEFGFCLKYPGEWEVSTDYVYTADSRAVSFFDANSTDRQLAYPKISIEYANNRLNKEYAKSKNLRDFINKSADISLIGETEFFEREAYQVKLRGNYDVSGLIFARRGEIFIILLHPQKNAFTDLDKAVIDTLKFLR